MYAGFKNTGFKNTGFKNTGFENTGFEKEDLIRRSDSYSFAITDFFLRIKEIKMGNIIREIVFYLTFLQVTLLICFGEHDPDMFLMNKSMKDMFVDARYNGRMPFTKVILGFCFSSV